MAYRGFTSIEDLAKPSLLPEDIIHCIYHSRCKIRKLRLRCEPTFLAPSNEQQFEETHIGPIGPQSFCEALAFAVLHDAAMEFDDGDVGLQILSSCKADSLHAT